MGPVCGHGSSCSLLSLVGLPDCHFALISGLDLPAPNPLTQLSQCVWVANSRLPFGGRAAPDNKLNFPADVTGNDRCHSHFLQVSLPCEMYIYVDIFKCIYMNNCICISCTCRGSYSLHFRRHSTSGCNASIFPELLSQVNGSEAELVSSRSLADFPPQSNLFSMSISLRN